MGTLAEKIANLPAAPGVYLFKDARGEVLYVGKAIQLASRVRSYLSHDPQRPRMDEMIARATDVDTILTDTEAEALLLESTLIRQHRPHYNVLLKDPGYFDRDLARYHRVTAASLRDAVRRYLAHSNRVTLSVVPKGKTIYGMPGSVPSLVS